MPSNKKKVVAKTKKRISPKRVQQRRQTTANSRTVSEIPENTKLTVELVPSTCWFSNVRDHVTKEQWDRLRRQTYQKANYVCEICGGRGPEWPVECHEIWKYDDDSHIQTLIGLIALCPSCHQVKHIGLAGLQGKGGVAKEHLAKVNEWTKQQTDKYLNAVWATWRERSQHHWKLDFTWLEQLGIHIEPKR
jgi:5-methylcytosine-specific restriction endonuclease McrA